MAKLMMELWDRTADGESREADALRTVRDWLAGGTSPEMILGWLALAEKACAEVDDLRSRYQAVWAQLNVSDQSSRTLSDKYDRLLAENVRLTEENASLVACPEREKELLAQVEQLQAELEKAQATVSLYHMQKSRK